ncbi:GL23936 [Drosophila persimilis]|uniref:GL23936 n=1 Tax=Drosophila persimilis TaxID=7234 RepID=B4G2M8_DROPE|nr:GL23936 [Drosophila persimilis]
MKEIELHCRPQWMPQYEAIPKEIWNLLLFRFSVATLLCIYLDLFFLLYSFCQSYLLGVLEDTFVSTVLLVIVQPGVVAYGLLLCHNHNKPPIYYQRRIQRLLMEIPLKLLLLGIVLYLHMIKNIYEMIMQKELPLDLIPRVHLGDNERLWDPVVLWICRQNLWPMPEEMIELQLSFHMALDTKCLYGLHLLAAHEFHVAAASKCDFLCPTLFSLAKINPISWQELREVIMGMVDEFVANMKSAIEDTTSPDQLFQRNAKDKPRKEGMRKLSATLPIKTTPNALVLVEKQLNAAQNMKIVRNGRLCGTHHKLLVGIKHCMFGMLYHFSPYLDDIVQGDEQMLKILKCWMEKLGIPHSHLP